MKNSKALSAHLVIILAQVAEVCREAGITFFVVGAYAQILWMSDNDEASRSTRDVDIAVYVDTVAAFARLKEKLTNRFGYQSLKHNPLRLVIGNAYEVDLLPFSDASFELRDRSVTSLVGVDFDTSGIAAAYPLGLRASTVGDTTYHTASMPAVVLMKMLAIGGKPELRLAHDLTDILLIIKHYYHFELDSILDHHADIYQHDLSEFCMSARIVGREVRRLSEGHAHLRAVVPQIFNFLIAETSTLVSLSNHLELDEVEVFQAIEEMSIGFFEDRKFA